MRQQVHSIQVNIPRSSLTVLEIAKSGSPIGNVPSPRRCWRRWPSGVDSAWWGGWKTSRPLLAPTSVPRI
jgi:hypothetical protein